MDLYIVTKKEEISRLAYQFMLTTINEKDEVTLGLAVHHQKIFTKYSERISQMCHM